MIGFVLCFVPINEPAQSSSTVSGCESAKTRSLGASFAQVLSLDLFVVCGYSFAYFITHYGRLHFFCLAIFMVSVTFSQRMFGYSLFSISVIDCPRYLRYKKTPPFLNV